MVFLLLLCLYISLYLYLPKHRVPSAVQEWKGSRCVLSSLVIIIINIIIIMIMFFYTIYLNKLE